ncbi:hypothetical protein [Reichenbachiella versicolor]|uniref:hypothetical protein n=1 Tax=Reichenbachiella versicolor TaxID=1821036 RepID=UPI000D6E13E1|nr:hypothetical protein [Reichenbachiella versicolor]
MSKYIYPTDFEGTFWSAHDGDFYVSTIGNDITGTGSPTNPFLTVHRAMTEASDSDKIIIGPQEYVFDNDAESSCKVLICRLAAADNIAISLGGLLLVDGVQTIEGDRVLVSQQHDPKENGIYVARNGAWTRALDFSNSDNMISGALVSILEGTTQSQSVFQYAGSPTITVDSDPVSFKRTGIPVWGQVQGNVTDQSDLVTILDGKANLTDIDNLKEGVPTEGDTLNKLYNLIQNIIGVSASATDISDRDAQKPTLVDQQNIYVTDATSDPSVTTGWAIYKYIQPTDSFVKIMEQESLDVSILTEGNGITIDGNNINLGGEFTSDISLSSQDGKGVSVVSSGGINLISYQEGDSKFEKHGSGQLNIESSTADDMNISKKGDGALNVSSDGGMNISNYSPKPLDITSDGEINITKNSIHPFKITSNGGEFSITHLGNPAVFNSPYGLRYGSNYSENFVDRSLVDKAYVDNITQATTGGNGITKNDNEFDLGGTFSENINLNSSNASRLSISSYDGTTYAGSVDIEEGAINLRAERVVDQRSLATLSLYSSRARLFSEWNNKESGYQIEYGRLKIIDNVYNEGVTFDKDYSDNFTDRSLVDKAYVDKKSTKDEFISLSADTTLDDSYSGKILLLTGTITITMPASPSTGFNVGLRNKDANVKTINMNGNPLEYKGSGNPTMVEQHDMAALTFDGTAFLGTGELT